MRKGGGGGGKWVDRARGEMESGRQKHRPSTSVVSGRRCGRRDARHLNCRPLPHSWIEGGSRGL